MKANQLATLLEFAIPNQFPILIKGAPGVGKSDIVSQAADATGARLIISHPVVSDPTDYKGLPFVVNGKAVFLAFGELEELLNATVPTVYFLDDLGQAPPSVQAACMQLLLARQINGHKVSNMVTFIAATNRREDNAAVSGILNPVKSRFDSIVELEFDLPIWMTWAMKNGMPSTLTSFLQLRPQVMDIPQSKDIVNTPCARTLYKLGRMINAGLPDSIFFETAKGSVGEAFAFEFQTFLKIYASLPTFSEITSSPSYAPVPSDLSSQYALTGMIAEKVTPATISPVMIYLKRLPEELAMATIKNAFTRTPAIANTPEFITWASANAKLFV